MCVCVCVCCFGDATQKQKQNKNAKKKKPRNLNIKRTEMYRINKNRIPYNGKPWRLKCNKTVGVQRTSCFQRDRKRRAVGEKCVRFSGRVSVERYFWRAVGKNGQRNNSKYCGSVSKKKKKLYFIRETKKTEQIKYNRENKFSKKKKTKIYNRNE